MNPKGEIEKQRDNYLSKSKLKDMEIFTLEVPRESEPVIDPNIRESTPNSSNPESSKSFEVPIALGK